MQRQLAWGHFILGWLTTWSLCPAVVAQMTAEPDGGVIAIPDNPLAESTPPQKKRRQWFFEGYASEEYRFRHSTSPALPELEDPDEILADADGVDAETDHDLRLFLSGYLWEDSDHFAADISMGLWEDLNGVPSPGEPAANTTMDDYASPKGWREPYDVYSLHAEYRTRGIFALARGGRQTAEHGRPVTFDGVTVRLRALDPYLDIFFYGGRSVHFFELNSDLFEDWLASTGLVVRPSESLRIEVDYRFTKEDTTISEDVMDHSYGLTAWYRFSEWAKLKGHLRGLNDVVSHAGGGPWFEWTELELGVEAGADAQIVTLGEINERDNPYFTVLGESLPHVLVHCDVWKDFTTDVGIYSIHGGWNGRLLTENEQTAFNRDYGRAYLWFQATDIGISGPFANLIVEYHYTHTSAELNLDSLFSVGGSAGYEWNQLKGEIGSYYYRYKYNYYMDVRELQNVRNYFTEIRYDPLKWLSIRLRYEYDQWDRDVHTLTLKLAQTY